MHAIDPGAGGEGASEGDSEVGVERVRTGPHKRGGLPFISKEVQ